MTIDFKTLDLRDSLDLAILIEEEACERYKEFAEQIGSRYRGDAGDFFKEMALNEEKHGRQLSDRRNKLFKDAPRRVNPIVIWDIEAPAAGKPRPYMSPRQAMELALSAETKAYRFFDDALPYIVNAEVRALFTELRNEEGEHRKALEKQIALLPPGDGPDLSDDDLDEPSAL